MKKILTIALLSSYLFGYYDGTSAKTVSVEYYENGKMKSNTTYLKELPNGMSTQYYQDGKIKKQTSYKNGELHGTSRKYYANGKLESEITYRNGEKTGLSQTYYKNGNLKSQKYITSYTNMSESDYYRY